MHRLASSVASRPRLSGMVLCLVAVIVAACNNGGGSAGY